VRSPGNKAFVRFPPGPDGKGKGRTKLGFCSSEGKTKITKNGKKVGKKRELRKKKGVKKGIWGLESKGKPTGGRRRDQPGGNPPKYSINEDRERRADLKVTKLGYIGANRALKRCQASKIVI